MILHAVRLLTSKFRANVKPSLTTSSSRRPTAPIWEIECPANPLVVLGVNCFPNDLLWKTFVRLACVVSSFLVVCRRLSSFPFRRVAVIP